MGFLEFSNQKIKSSNNWLTMDVRVITLQKLSKLDCVSCSVIHILRAQNNVR